MKRISVQDLDHILDRTESCWRELSKARFFLTGCTGFFGVWILESFLRAGQKYGIPFDLTLLTRNPETFLHNHPQFAGRDGFRFVRGDIAAFAFPAGGFSHVIHGATTRAQETFDNEPPLGKFQTVAEGTRRVLDFCVEKKACSMIYLGSGSAYGKQPAGVPLMAEDSLLAPETMNADAALGHSKRVAEFFCAAYAERYSLDIKITRCFSFLGPHLPLDIHYAAGNFVRDGIKGRAIRLKGDGRPVRSYLYMSDLVIWLMTILFKGKSLHIYNVGSENGRSIRELAELVGKSFDPPLPVEQSVIPESAPATAAPDFYVPSTLRARTELGLEETVSLEEGIRKTIEFYR